MKSETNNLSSSIVTLQAYLALKDSILDIDQSSNIPQGKTPM